jgi:hypothetical protein
MERIIQHSAITWQHSFWFALMIKKRQMNESVDYRVNIITHDTTEQLLYITDMV